MSYLVQGYNGITCQWESLPYRTEDFRTLYQYPLESMAIAAMRLYAELWPTEYRVVKA